VMVTQRRLLLTIGCHSLPQYATLHPADDYMEGTSTKYHGTKSLLLRHTHPLCDILRAVTIKKVGPLISEPGVSARYRTRFLGDSLCRLGTV